jgi:uncharacterized protein
MFSEDPIIDRWLQAAAQGETAVVTGLLDSGFDINVRDRRDESALFYAVRFGHRETIRVLLDRGAELEFVDCYGYTALTHAIQRSQPRCWEPGYIPDPGPSQMLVEAGARFHLIDAFWTNDLELFRVRLEEGSSPDHGEGSYHGPVLVEAARAGRVAMIDLLLDHGANIEAEDDLGNRPLLSAAEYGQIEAVKRLLDRGADLEATNWSGVSALANAAARNHREIVEFLFSHGARRGIVDALTLNDPTIMAHLLDEALRQGRDIDWISDGYRRIALVAAERGNPEMVRLLLDRGATHLVDHFGDHSLLAEAARHGHLEVIRLLIDRGADLHAVGRDGLSPLAWATQAGQDEAAKLLRLARASPETS